MTKTTHIVVLASYKIYPAKMGGQKGIAFFYKYFSRLLPVTVISTKNNEVPDNNDIQFLPVLGNSKLRYIDPFLFFKVRNIIRRNNASHLIIEHPYYGWLGLLLRSACKIKLVVHSHNIEALRFKSTGRWWWPILWRYEKFVHRKADINFFITDEDREFAIKNFVLDPSRCFTITYGFEMNAMPLQAERLEAKKHLQQFHKVDPEEKILLFNGTLDYKPNQDAVDVILQHINPALLATAGFKYKIIICGKGLPHVYNELKNYADQNIIFAGFVDDINIYFKGADIFINPVIDGGGIKTKLVEALGYGLSAVSTKNGAIGVLQTVTGNKMHIADDWESFTKTIRQVDTTANTPPSFYEHFYWGNIAAEASAAVSKNS